MTEKIIPTTYAEVVARFPAELEYMKQSCSRSRSKSAKEPLDKFEWFFCSDECDVGDDLMATLRNRSVPVRLVAYIFATHGRLTLSSRFYDNKEWFAVTPPEVLAAWGRTEEVRMSEEEEDPMGDISDEDVLSGMGFTKL